MSPIKRPRFGGVFLFLPFLKYSHAQAFAVPFVSSMQNYTTTTQKPFTGLYRGFSVDLPYFSAYNTAAAQAAYTPPAPRRRAYRQALHLHRYQIPLPHRTLYRARQPPIIIRYIRVHGCAPVVDSCQTVQHTTDHASPAACSLAPGQLGTLHPEGSPAAAAEGGRNHWWLVAALLFGLSPDS